MEDIFDFDPLALLNEIPPFVGATANILPTSFTELVDEFLFDGILNNDFESNIEVALGKDTSDLQTMLPDNHINAIELLADIEPLFDIEALTSDDINSVCQNPLSVLVTDQVPLFMNPGIFTPINGNILVSQQPRADKARYEGGERRYLADSRHHPMAIKLPTMTHIKLESNQQLGIIVTLVTSDNNTHRQTYVHANDITCNENNVIKVKHGCLFVPLTVSDIDACEKKFPKLSIVHKKYKDYSFKLIRFDTTIMFGIEEIYTLPNENAMTKVAKGKKFKEAYDLSSYKFIFQLALKENESIHVSYITCETDLISELPGASTKRIVSEPFSEGDDAPRLKKRSSRLQKNRSTKRCNNKKNSTKAPKDRLVSPQHNPRDDVFDDPEQVQLSTNVFLHGLPTTYVSQNSTMRCCSETVHSDGV